MSLEKHATYGACWGDYNRDGWLDLLYNVHNYNGDQTGGNHLYQNNADGTFTEVTEIAAMGNENRVPFASAFLDYNNDQWPDIYTANDKLTANTLYENLGNGRFYNASTDTKSNARMNGMCVNAADINQDGWVDIYVTNTFVGGQLLENSGPQESILDITFENVAPAMGIDYKNGNGWSSTFFDADNDGDLDLYMCGNSSNPSVKGVHFYENIDKTHFEIITDGFEQDTFNSFSNAIGDFDADGMLDILVQNNNPAPFHLWDNQTSNDNNWIKIKLVGVLSNRDAIGTRIETYAGDLFQSNFTYCGFGFLGQNTNKQHIGLGQHSQVDSMIITWPSGHIDRLYQLAPNQLHEITEGATTHNQISVAADVTILPREMSTSIATISPANYLQIAPNPAIDYLQVQATFKIEILSILSSTGQSIQQFSVLPTNSTNVTLPDLPQGLYLLKAQDGKGNYALQKWIKKS
ncbi:MAG: FG-GAP-like repeat-containing protein [Saprospiraceae bacterium]